DALCRIASGGAPRLSIAYRSFDERRRDWDAFLQSAPDAKDLRERITGIVLPRFIWADTLAVHYSHLYRSAYVLAYALSAVAVFIALATVFIHDDPHAPASEVLGTKAAFILLELIVISGIIILVRL